MERYLKIENLESALGDGTGLPSPDQLRELIAEAEVSLFVSSGKLDDTLLEIGWYLFSVANIRLSYQKYGIERQRNAYQVAGYIFDLALKTEKVENSERPIYVVATQVCYLRSLHQPNAIAVTKKYIGDFPEIEHDPKNLDRLAIYTAIALLGFKAGQVYKYTAGFSDWALEVTRQWGIDSMRSTPFGASFFLTTACRQLVSYMIYGKSSLLESARAQLKSSISCEGSYESKDVKLASSLLLSLTDDWEKTSIWNALPPDVPDNVRRAFTSGKPRVMSLWPPQMDYLADANPFDDNIKHQFISTPTSGGKTLLAQLIISHHLTTRHTSACYIAPTRSLCREVQVAMKNRLKYLNVKANGAVALEGFGFSEEDLIEPTVEVMTPEGLSSLLRKDPSAVFNKFGLFVFDEIHSVGDLGRGQTLENVITLLKSISTVNESRIALISAVVGNRNHFVSWLGSNGENIISTHTDWRGPRRLYGVWSTEHDWNSVKRSENMRLSTRSTHNKRRFYDLYGKLTLRKSLSGDTVDIQTNEPIGDVAFTFPISRKTHKIKLDSKHSVKKHQRLMPLIDLLSLRGPLLCIEATKPETVRLALAIADSRSANNRNDLEDLIAFVEAKLSQEHPLSKVIKHGVAYHHASLPSDVRAEIENAVVRGEIDVLVATTTMTEGVNLPVQAVLIASEGTYTNEQEFLELIKGSKMANAIGRAGRATQETEGVVVLYDSKGRPLPDVFKAMDPDDEAKNVLANGCTEKFLEEYQAYENLKRSSADAIFECDSSILSNFISFVWFYLHTINPEGDVDDNRLSNFLSNSMAWVQADSSRKAILHSITTDVKKKYSEASNSQRAIFARSSSSLQTTKVLRRVYERIRTSLTGDGSVIDTIKIVFSPANLGIYNQLVEAPNVRVVNKRSGRSKTEIRLPVTRILEDWVNGMPYPELAAKYFNRVEDPEFRFEQLGDFISDYFDNFLPWIFATVIGWANDDLDEEEAPLSTYLPGLIKVGVPNETALTLLQQGIYSRQLAIKISGWKDIEAPEEPNYKIKGILQRYKIQKLISDLSLTANETQNLIDYITDDKVKLLSSLINEGEKEIDLWDSEATGAGPVSIQGNPSIENFKLVNNAGNIAGTIPTIYHTEIIELLTGGIPFQAEITSTWGLKITLLEFEA